jgi:hypothetical protein
VDDSRQPQACSHLHLSYDLPTDDWVSAAPGCHRSQTNRLLSTNAINSYAPLIFKNLGITGTNTGLFATGIYGIVKMVTCSIFLLFMADSLGRRRSLFLSSIGQGFCMFYIGLWLRFDPPEEGADVAPAGYVALVCIFVFAMFFQFGWGPVCWIYVSEIPTSRLRGLNVSIAAATQWLFNFVVVRAVPTMLVTVGANGYGTYLIFGSFAAAMFVFVWFCGSNLVLVVLYSVANLN